MTSDEMPECPLCMVELFYDDLGFYPCSCGYQICRFCWSKILNEENGLCPACRRAYDSEAPASFTPLSEEQLQKFKREKRQKERKNKTIENRKHLADIRVVQKNLAFVIGLPQRFAEQTEVLKSTEYFGKYGKVFKVVVNKNATQPGSQNQNTVGAYVTFVKGEDTIQAIMDLNKQQMEGRTLKASLGTTKYCSQFLKGASCTKGECMYLHELGEEAASFTKEEMQQNKHTEYERKLIEDYIEQNGIATDSRLSSSSPSNTSQSQSSNQSISQQNQNQGQSRLQHASECRDHSSSSSSSNTPPSSRRQTKSESQHRSTQHHIKHQTSHRQPVGVGSLPSSSGDGSTTSITSQRTPRKNSQSYKQPHSQSSHSRNVHGQKQQKQRSAQQPNQQTHIQQTNSAPSNKQSSQPHPKESQSSKPLQTSSMFPVSCEPSETCTPSDDTATISASEETLTSNPFPISTGLSFPSNLVRFDHPGSLNDSEQAFSNAAASGNDDASIPQSSTSISAESPSSLRPSSSLIQNPMQMRQHNQVINGLSGSAAGMQPHQLSMYSYSTLQLMLDYQRQQLQQQQQQQETQHQYQHLVNSFDSQCIPTTSFQSDQSNHAGTPVDLGEDRGFPMHVSQSKWPVTDPSSMMPQANPVMNSLSDVAFSAHDDANLDFDPVKESQQALAALLEHERNHSAVSNMPTCGTGNYLSNSNTQQGLTPPPGFEVLPQYSAPNRSSLLRSSMNPCHPGMMGYGYYSSGVPPGAMDMGLVGDSCQNHADKCNMSVGGATTTNPQHLAAANSTVSHSSAANNSPGLSFNVKALQDTLRCVLPETKITFDPSLMREMQYPTMNTHTTQSSIGTPSQIPSDAITSSNNPPGLSQLSDAMTASSKETSSLWPQNGFCMDDDPAVLASAPGANNPLQHEYCSLWPSNPSQKDCADDSDSCIRNDAVWSSPITPPGFGTSVISLLGGLGSSNVHRVGVEGQRSAISVDAQTTVTATGDQQHAINKI